MKKLFITMMIASSFMLVSSCSKTDTNPAVEDVKASISVKVNDTITVLDNGAAFPDDHMVVTVTCTGNDKNSLTHIKLTASNSTTGPVIDTVITGTSATKTYSWTVAGHGPVTYTATVTGSAGNPGTATLTVNIIDIVTANPVLGNQYSTANKRFWSSANAGIYTYDLSDVLASANYALDTLIDLGYCSRTLDAHLMFSPDDTANANPIYGAQWGSASERITNWHQRNATRFILTNITQAQFNAAATSKAKIYALMNAAKTAPLGGEPNAKSAGIFDTQVYLFKTAGGKYGLILILSANGAVNTPGDVSLLVAYEN